MNKNKFLTRLEDDMIFIRFELDKLEVKPDLRRRIKMESKLELLEDLRDSVRLGFFDDNNGLACIVKGSPTGLDKPDNVV